MYIQEIIIDGFKSYAQKTVVSGFDPQFNAITGLNGSGKSNILDSICFVLGITNLSQVRVGNLQELVYKQGQAGVTKATVTIIFNNSDVSTSPIGYESHKQISVTRQVAIGGKNKYMINGHTVQQSQVQNFFHSVQLNVNNPHFLIMQGRITKVLNMKPEEILSMIEEAAGTRMFEAKKQVSLKTMEKKQAKVDEITKCINEEITPTLENLRTERLDYHKFQKNQLEYDRLLRVSIAFEFHQHEEKLLHSEQFQLTIQEELQELQAQIQLRNKEVDAINLEIHEIAHHRDNEMASEIDRLKKEESLLSKEVVKINTLVSNHQEVLNNEEENRKNLMKNISATEKLCKTKHNQLNVIQKEIEEKSENAQRIETDYLMKCEQYQNIFAGRTDENTTELLSHNEQVLTWEKYERETKSKLQTNDQKLQFSQKKLSDFNKKNEKVKSSSNYDEILKENEELLQTIKHKEKLLEQLTVKEQQLNEANGKSSNIHSQLAQSINRYESIQASLQARLSFEYTNPEKGFNREVRVKGFIANLFSLKDSQYAVGLEVIAGGKLREVVVDNEQTGKLLLEKGNLKKRVTILPLNKLSSSVVSADKIQKAKDIAVSMKGSAFSPLELISFSPEMRKAMDYAFGNSILCSSADIAKTIAFNPEIRVKAVTFEGDCYDPAGTLTGGSNQSLGSMLMKLSEFRELGENIENLKKSLQRHQQELKQIEEASHQMAQISSEIEILSHTLKMNETKLSETDFAQIVSQKQEMEAEICSIEEERKQLMELLSKAKSELLKLSKMEKSMKSSKEQKMKEFEKQMKLSQQECNASKNQLISLKAKQEALLTEIGSLEKEVTAFNEQKKQSDTSLARAMQEKHDIDEKLAKVREQYDRISSTLNQKSQEFQLYSKEIQQLEKAKEEKLKSSQHHQLEVRKATHKLQQWEKDIKESQKLIQSYLKEYSWINKEKQYFGQVNTDFDFQARDMKQTRQKVQELKEEQEKLAKKVNKKVMGMIETAENEYDELTRKREVILKDKAKIESVIEELDLKKIQSLQKTYDQVNKDFGSIFSMLLPGTTAKLEPVSDKSIMEGLEVKVAFNGVWKESLTELSGGQRSLLALSLILALLLFKPAPMYILDEVDAALDLSHTQNIGLMIRTHFSSSQFIVVSLKEGMFNNANVIFRTKFIDGVSTVTRTVSGARAKSQHTPALQLSASENVENEINRAVAVGLQTKKQSGIKKQSAKNKLSIDDEDDDFLDDDGETEVPARKRGKTHVISDK